MTPTTARAAEQPQPGDKIAIWGGQYRLLTLGLTLTVAGAAFEALAVATTLPATVADLGGISLYGWAFSAFMLTNIIGVTVAGDEADRTGPAQPFVIGVLLFMLGLVIAGLAPTMAVVIAGRAVQGFGAGVLSSVAYVAIGRGYPESARPRMLAVLASAWVIPGLVGPALAGLVADHVGWRWVFLGLAPLTPLAALMALPALRRLSQQATAPRSWRRALLAIQLAAGFGLALAGLGALPTAAHAALATLGLGSLDTLVRAALVGAGLALGLPALRSVLPAGTLRAVPGLPAAIATMGLLNLAFFGADAFVPLALTEARGQSASFAGLALTAATIFWTTGAWVQARLASRVGRRPVALSGLGLIAVGVAGTAATLLAATPVLLGIVAWGVAGLGMGLAFSTGSLTVLEQAPQGQEGLASAGMQLANQLGVATGAGIGGAIVAALAGQPGGIAQALLLQNGLMLLVIALTALAAWRLPARV